MMAHRLSPGQFENLSESNVSVAALKIIKVNKNNVTNSFTSFLSFFKQLSNSAGLKVQGAGCLIGSKDYKYNLLKSNV